MYFLIFLSMLLMNTLERTVWTEASFISDISLYITFIAVLFMVLKTWLFPIEVRINYRLFYLVMLLFMIYLSYSVSVTTFMELEEYVRLMLHLLFIIAVIRAHFNQAQVKAAGYFFSLIVILFFFHWLWSGMPLQGFKSIYKNENFLAVLLFSLLYFQVLAGYYSKRIESSIFRICIILNLLLIVVSGARSVLIAMFMIAITALCIKYYPTILNRLLSIVILASMTFVGLYVSLSFTTVGKKLNDLIHALTGKNLFSGRHEIWEAVMLVIFEKPFTGYGMGVRAHDIADIDLTAHNMFLQIILEYGIVGFILFWLLLFTIWRLLLKRLDNFAAKWSLCFMTGILVYNTFELTLFQNNYSIAVFQWLIIAIGVGFVQKKSSHN